MTKKRKKESFFQGGVFHLDNRSFQNHLFRIVSIPVVFIFILLIFLHFQNSYIYSLGQETTRLEQLNLHAAQLEKHFIEIENDLRGYVLSGHSTFKRRLTNSLEAVEPAAEDVYHALGSDYETGRSLRKVMIVYDRFRDYVDESVNTRSNSDSRAEQDAEKALMAGNKIYNQLHTEIGAFRDTLSSEIVQLKAEQRSIIKWTKWLEFTFAVVLAFFVVFIMIRQLKNLTFNYRKLLQTNIRNLEELTASARTKDLFLANMSHEIRTPLGAIIGFTDLLFDKKEMDQEAKNHISFIKRNSQHLLGLVDDLFDVTRLSADKLELHFEDVDLSEFFNDLTNSFREKLQEKNIELALIIETRIPQKVITDPLRLNQILFNLLGNAIKFSPPNSNITFVLAYSADQLQIDVIDKGIGIDPSVQKNIFEAFVQADPEHTRRFGGAGLGLSISKKLADAMGGTLELVFSKVNQGSHFRLGIPCQATTYQFVTELKYNPNKNVSRGDSEDSKPSVYNFGNKKVLLAEDSIENQVLFKLFIKSTNAQLTVVDNGSDAVKKALTDDFDLILMDIQMPGLDGYEAVGQLRNKNYDKKIIALTAHTMKGEKDKCLNSGFDDYISKPVSQQKLLKAMAKVLT